MTMVIIFLTLILSAVHAYSPCDTLDIVVLFDPLHVLHPTVDITAQLLKNMVEDMSYESSLHLIPHSYGKSEAGSSHAIKARQFKKGLAVRAKASRKLDSYFSYIRSEVKKTGIKQFVAFKGKRVLDVVQSLGLPSKRRVIISLNRWYPGSTRLEPRGKSKTKPLALPFTFIFDYNYDDTIYKYLPEHKYDDRKEYLSGSTKDKFIYYGAMKPDNDDTKTEYQESNEWKLIGNDGYAAKMKHPEYVSKYLRAKVYRVICPQTMMWTKSDETKPENIDFQLAPGVEILQEGDIIDCDLYFEAGIEYEGASIMMMMKKPSRINMRNTEENKYRFKEGTILVAPYSYYNSDAYEETGCRGKLKQSPKTRDVKEHDDDVRSRGSAVFQITNVQMTSDLERVIILTVVEPKSLSNIVSVIQKYDDKKTRRRLISVENFKASGAKTIEKKHQFTRKFKPGKKRKWTSLWGWPTFRVEGDGKAEVEAGFSVKLDIGFDVEWRSNGEGAVYFNTKLNGNFKFAAWFELFLSRDIVLTAEDFPRISVGIPLPIPFVPIRVYPFLSMGVEAKLNFALKYRYDYSYTKGVELGYKYEKTLQYIGAWRRVHTHEDLESEFEEDLYKLRAENEEQCKLWGMDSCGIGLTGEPCAFVEYLFEGEEEYNCYLYNDNDETFFFRTVHYESDSGDVSGRPIGHRKHRWMFTGVLEKRHVEKEDNGAYYTIQPTEKKYSSSIGFVDDKSDREIRSCPVGSNNNKIDFQVTVKAGFYMLNEMIKGYIEFEFPGTIFVHIPLLEGHNNQCDEADGEILSTELCDRYHHGMKLVPSLMVGATIKIWKQKNLVFEFDPNGIVPFRCFDLELDVYRNKMVITPVDHTKPETIHIKNCVAVADGKSRIDSFRNAFNKQLYEKCCYKEESERTHGKPTYSFSKVPKIPMLPSSPDFPKVPDFPSSPADRERVIYDVIRGISEEGPSRVRRPSRRISRSRPLTYGLSAGIEYDDLMWNEYEGKQTENKYAVRTLEITVAILVLFCIFCICSTGLCVVNAFVWKFNGFCKKRNYLELDQHESEV